MRSKPFDCCGFTLLEVLIAVMILGLSITAILHQFSVALRAGSIARENTQAVIYARQKIEELKTAKEIGPFSESGRFDDGFAWQTEVSEYNHPEYEADPELYDNLRFETFIFKAIVTWQDGDRMVELATLHNVRKKQWK